jgi:penicillin-binding protein 1A
LSKFQRLLTFAGIAGIAGALLVTIIVVVISFSLPQINSLNDYNPPIPSRIYSKDGELLLEVAKERREVVAFEEIPQRIVQAFLAAEDDNFYNHSGVDYVGIARAMVKNILAGRVVQGASTITQQVAKSLLLTSERTFTRKIKDLLLAKKIEERFSKQEILFLYLNQVYLGGGYYGVKKAFNGYFGKELEEATIAEAALIAGLLVAPGKYSPYVHPEYAKTRQRYVLRRLFETKKITEEEYNQALAEEIKLKKRLRLDVKAGYFTDWILQNLFEEYGKKDFVTNGYEVVTTINWKLQKRAEELIKEGLREVDKRQGFKGSIQVGVTEEVRREDNVKKRRKLFDEASQFFTFFPDGHVEDEFVYNEEFFLLRDARDQLLMEQVPERYHEFVEPGIYPNDPATSFVKEGDFFEGHVVKTSNYQRLIYIEFAGMKGVIPYEHYKWAHERVINEERKWFGPIKYPSQIVKPGDMVRVRVQNKPQGIWGFVNSDYKTKVKSAEADQVIQKEKYFILSLEQEPDVQGALLSVSPFSGEIIAMVGGYDFDKSKFNRVVQSNRQPGSAFKPLIYAVGLENGFTPASILLDSPQALGGAEQSLNWKPRNYDGTFKGRMTFREALEVSRNIPTIRLTQQVGVDKIIDFMDRMDVNVELPKDLSVSLGSFGINLLDLVKVYSIFPNGGKKIELKSVISVKDREGKVLTIEDPTQEDKEEEVENEDLLKPLVEEAVANNDKKEDANLSSEDIVEEEAQKIKNQFLAGLTERQVYDPRLAYLMTNILKGVVQNGTGKRASDISSFIGGKTGTTNNYVDAWFLGFSAKIVTGVWSGFDNNETLGWPETGASAALPAWREFMKSAIAVFGDPDFKIPEGIINVPINKSTGEQVSSGGGFIEAFVEGTEPGSEIREAEQVSPENEDSNAIIDDGYYSDQY